MSKLQHLLVKLGIRTEKITGTFVPEGSRTIPVNAHSLLYLHNSVSTSKYSVITFVPRFLFEFFSNYANLFFLFTGSIQLIGTLSPTSRYGTIFPLIAIFIMQATKDLIEDGKRHLMDNTVNNSIVKVLYGEHFIEKKWSELKVGDLVRIEGGQYFPADIVLLSSSEPDALCFIETANLDG
jgi:phospholipid-transporting ATPase